MIKRIIVCGLLLIAGRGVAYLMRGKPVQRPIAVYDVFHRYVFTFQPVTADDLRRIKIDPRLKADQVHNIIFALERANIRREWVIEMFPHLPNRVLVRITRPWPRVMAGNKFMVSIMHEDGEWSVPDRQASYR